MNTHFDKKVRVVSLENLKAMCDRASGECHRFEVTKVTRSRVHVTYSNPDEYAVDHPVTAVYPIYPNVFESENPSVVLDVITMYGPEPDIDCFYLIEECGPLFRHERNGKVVWESEYDILVLNNYRKFKVEVREDSGLLRYYVKDAEHGDEHQF